MNIKEIKKILNQHFLCDNNDFIYKGRLLYYPTDLFLRGFYFEHSSSNKNILALEVFVLPLFIPKEHLSFNFGYRIRRQTGEEWWDIENNNMDTIAIELSDAIKTEGIPYLHSVRTPELFIKNSAGQLSDSPYWLQAKAYAFCLIENNIQIVNKVLEELINDLQSYNEDKSFDWVMEMINRAKELNNAYREDLSTGRKMMDDFIEYTKKHLKI